MKKIKQLLLVISSVIILPACGLLLFYGNQVNVTYGATPVSDKQEILPYLTPPPGFEVSIFADIDAPLRQLATGDDGWVFVGSRADKVYALRDTNGDGVADQTRIVARGLSRAHGVAYHRGDLYIGATPTIYRIRNIAAALADTATEIELSPFIIGLPTSGHHGLRHIKVGPDNMLYVALGVPCNICEPPPGELAGVIRRYPISGDNGGAGEVYARGIRNAVGFDFHPQTQVLWFTDNGRDWLGDELPHDELNRVSHIGEHFGYPFCHQGDLPDIEYGNADSCAYYTAPVLKTGPHVGNLGMDFSADGNTIYIALHGSWNRSEKIGYDVHRVLLNGDKVVKYEPFITGWLQANEDVLGRPADVAVTAAGDILISDDFAGAIYRVYRATPTTE